MQTCERPVGEHDWLSSEYVDFWINRDKSRDGERRARLRAMLTHARLAADAVVSVLDIGGGYGVVTEEVLLALPRARVCLQDYSGPMLEVARGRLAAHASRVDFVQADLTDPGWAQALGGPFDLAVSAIAIHNLRDLGAIAACYHDIAGVLNPGARFLDYDLFFDNVGGVSHHIELLHAAGFTRVECAWQQPPLATLVAVKS